MNRTANINVKANLEEIPWKEWGDANNAFHPILKREQDFKTAFVNKLTKKLICDKHIPAEVDWEDEYLFIQEVEVLEGQKQQPSAHIELAHALWDILDTYFPVSVETQVLVDYGRECQILEEDEYDEYVTENLEKIQPGL